MRWSTVTHVEAGHPARVRTYWARALGVQVADLMDQPPER